MSVFAAVMTGKGTGAISTVQVFGDSAEDIIKKIFKPRGTKPVILKPGKILLGQIYDGSETIDHVAIGCEEPNSFAINCHGNPLIVADIMQLLAQHGATLLTAEQLLCKILSAEKPINTIALEAKLTQPKAKTIEGTKIIANQTEAGLSRKATEWLQNINTISLKQITADAAQILRDSQTAKLIVAGCTAAITGPPNSGKSTLLNCLCGKQKAIVTDIKGTTRDWVSARCQIGSLSVELIDTAGLDEKPTITPKDIIKKASQEKSVQILEEADLVLLVLDNSQTSEQLDGRLLEKIADKKVLTILNKSDLPTKFDAGKLPQILGTTVQISAKFGTGIENLLKKIRQICGVADFDLKLAVCITGRQENLVKQLSDAKSRSEAASIITELLNGQLSV
jgi:tRNA modification GTPase